MDGTTLTLYSFGKAGLAAYVDDELAAWARDGRDSKAAHDAVMKEVARRCPCGAVFVERTATHVEDSTIVKLGSPPRRLSHFDER